MVRTRKRFLFKQTWYSVCSKHYHYDANCDPCNEGIWVYDWQHGLSTWTYRNFPSIWHWFMSL